MKAKLTPILLMAILVLVSTALANVNVTLTDVNGNVIQGEQFSDTFTITNNEDTSNVTFTATDLVSGGNSIDSSAVTFTPDSLLNLINGTVETITLTVDVPTYQALGTYTSTITATADNGTETNNFTSTLTLEVLTSNSEPVFISTPDKTATKNEAYSYQANVTDADSDSLTYALVTGPAGLTVSSTGLVSWTPANTGSEEVNISVTDGKAIVYQVWTIVISEPSASLSLNDVKLGDSNQEREETISETFVLKNTGTLTVSNITLTTNANSDFEVVFTLPYTTLAAGEEMTVSIDAFVPSDLDAGENKIGSIIATGTATEDISTSANLFMEVENNLIIDDVDITIDDKKKNLDDGDDFDTKPGDTVELKIKVANTFNDNIDIEDIKINVESDNDLDWDESEDISKIRDDDDDTVTLTFDVDLDIDDNDAPFEVEIKVGGTDENGAEHGETWKFEIDINKERDEIIISDIDFIPSTVSCDEDRVTANIKLSNIGRDDQDEAVLKVVIDSFDFEKIIKDISLDEGDEITKRVTIDLPSNVRAGLYDVDARVYTSTSDRDLTDVEIATLEIGSCTETNTNTETIPSTTGSNNGMDIITHPATSNPQVVQTVSGTKKVDNNNLYITLLIIIVILLAIIVVVLGVKAFKPIKK